MKRMNNKGFTLVELIAIVVLLAIVMGIGAVSVTKIIKDAKNRDYKLLIENINNAVELYYQECEYGDSTSISCPALSSGYYNIKLGSLVNYGFIKGNAKNSSDELILVNPNDSNSIMNCRIKYRYSAGKIDVVAVSTTGSCPTSY